MPQIFVSGETKKENNKGKRNVKGIENKLTITLPLIIKQ